MVKSAAILIHDRPTVEALQQVLAKEQYNLAICRDITGLGQLPRVPGVILIDPGNFVALRERDPATCLRLTRQAHVIFVLSLPEVLDAADILPMADAWVFADRNLDQASVLVALGEEGHCLLPAQFLSPDGVDHIRLGLLGRLSITEYQCLLELGHGTNNREIARKLALSEPAAKSTVRATLGKLHFRNRTEAGVFAARNARELAAAPPVGEGQRP